VVAGFEETRRQILIYSVVLLVAGGSPWFLGYTGLAYGLTALAAGAVMVALAWRVRIERDGSGLAAKRLFGFSILYLFVLFAVLLVERGLGA